MNSYWKDLWHRFRKSEGAFYLRETGLILGGTGACLFLFLGPIFYFNTNWQLSIATFVFYGIIIICALLVKDYKQYKKNC